MPELEFTGERIIPGLVDSNLFNEHFARYRFASRFAEGRMVLDAGCGSGYGTAQFRSARGVVAIDVSLEALQYAREQFALPQIRLAQASCEALPFAAASFDLVTAFEVIEHLENWPGLLAEANRVLNDSGLLLVSTPNKSFYAETRAAAGPNPFHVHEFDHAEFRSALLQVFPHVEIRRQNHAEAILLVADSGDRGDLALGNSKSEDAHFFLAICSRSPIPHTPPFAWVPQAANLLRERERHIALLKAEVAQKTAWIAAMESEVHDARQVIASREFQIQQRDKWVESLNSELDHRNASLSAWRGSSERLEAELTQLRAESAKKLAALELELKAAHSGYQNKIQSLEKEAAKNAELGAAETARLERETIATHHGYQRQIRSLEDELANSASAATLEIERLQAEAHTVHRVYQRQIASLETEIAAIRGGYEAAHASTSAELAEHQLALLQRAAAQEAELNTVHAGYSSAIARLEEDSVETHAAYQSIIRDLEAELTSVHKGYQSAIQEKENRVAELARKNPWIHLRKRLTSAPVPKPE